MFRTLAFASGSWFSGTSESPETDATFGIVSFATIS
jgi:hypothetical protein